MFRVDNLAFSFPIHVVPQLKVRQNSMKNGVRKYHFDDEKSSFTREIISSPYEWKSSLLIRFRPTYVENYDRELLQRYHQARYVASRTAKQLDLNIKTEGTLSGKPHIAFRPDLCSLYLESQAVYSLKLKRTGNAWVDGSPGYGEPETNNIMYAYRYLMMPENVVKILDALERHTLMTSFASCSDPIFTANN